MHTHIRPSAGTSGYIGEDRIGLEKIFPPGTFMSEI